LANSVASPFPVDGLLASDLACRAFLDSVEHDTLVDLASVVEDDAAVVHS
jgi:hypothetical protein